MSDPVTELRAKIKQRRSDAIKLRKRYATIHHYNDGQEDEHVTVMEWQGDGIKQAYLSFLWDARLLNRQLKAMLKEERP